MTKNVTNNIFKAKSISKWAMVVLPFYPDSFRDNVTSSIFINESSQKLSMFPNSMKRSDGKKNLKTSLFSDLFNAE